VAAKENKTTKPWLIINKFDEQKYWSIYSGWMDDPSSATIFDWSATSDFHLPPDGKWSIVRG
jgi:hypothetical protein